MNTLKSLKCAAVLLPALAMGLPMAVASDEQRTDPRSQERASSVTGHQYLETMPAQGYQSDSLIGQDVKSRRNNESIGTVSNLLLDEDDKVVAVVISVGGVLGIGERDVAIAWDQVERSTDGDETTLWVNLTEDSLKNAPKFDSDTKHSGREHKRNDQRTGQRTDQRSDLADQRADQRTAQQRTDQRDDQRTAQQRAQQRSELADQRSDRDDQRSEQRATATTSRTAQYMETMPARGYHSDSLVGQEVKSRNNNETIGTVSNLLLDNDGQVVAVVVGVGGLMGIGERDVAIAWDQVERTFDGDDVTLWVNLSEENLKDAPKYTSDRKDSKDRTTTRR